MVKRIGLGLLLCAATAAWQIGAVHAAVEISSRPTKDMSCTGGVCSPTAKNAVLNVTDLATMLGGGDTTVKSNSIAHDIEIDAALTWTSAHRLTLDSFHNITFNNPVTIAGEGGLNIDTNDGGTGGDYRFFRKGHVEFWSSSGAGLLVNHTRYLLADSMKMLSTFIRRGSSGNYALMKSINARKTYAEPPLRDFDGKFEGLGNAISHLTIHDSMTGTIGLFESLDSFAIVRDLVLSSVDIAATGSGQYVGAVAGDNTTSTVQNVAVSGHISGGVNSVIGGILGSGAGLMINCSSSAVIVGANGAVAGGLIGHNRHEITGTNVSTSFSTASISNAGGAAGGLVGQSLEGGAIANSYATGRVRGMGSASAGGLLGTRPADGGNIATSYSTGAVSSGAGAPVGGSIGEDDAAGSGISNDYWDLDTSGIGDPSQGAGNLKNDPGITGLTDAQLKSGLPPGFDPSVWAINPKINNGYPYLINNPPPK